MPSASRRSSPLAKKKPKSPASKAQKAHAANHDVIQVRGAHQNNLQGIDVDLPIGKLCVVTGPSGSGKSSLAFDTIYAEGQRRYVETFSPYTRQFFERMDKPKVDAIHGIPPAIAIEQVNNIRSTRSTVGTITEINDYLKMIFPRLAEAACPECARPVRPETPASILRDLLHHHAGQSALIGFEVEVPAKTPASDFFPFLSSQGYLRVHIFGETYRTDEPDTFGKKRLPARVFVVQDRVKLDTTQRTRLSEAIEAAIRLGKGQMSVVIPSESGTRNTAPANLSYSTDWRCADCDIRLPAPTPGLFSFNNPIGACPTCRGFGRTLGLAMRKAVPDENLSIHDGLVKAFAGETYRESQDDLERAAKRKGISITTPFADLSKEDQDWIIEGESDDPEEAWAHQQWYGVRGFFHWLESRSYKMHVRIFLSRFRAYTTCRDCGGGRLKKDALQFRVGGKTIADVWLLPVTDLIPTMESWPISEADHATEMLRKEVLSRLSYLDRAGLGYLHLDRQTRTLSGGELQRVNLTTCLGASLVNTLFVLDEPSIGLHPRDIGRLIGVMEGLRDKGNTLLVVEHEEAVIRAADHLLEIGPGRGRDGGHLVYSGDLNGLEKTVGSLTADYLTGRKAIEPPATRRKTKKSRQLTLRGAKQNNLQNLDIDFPLDVFCCVTGVSGSGKSTLVHEVLFRNLQRMRGEVCEDEPGRLRSITGHEKLGQVVLVDQSPLARTPRSTPAVYVGAFDLIRQLFSETDDGKAQGLTPGFFSFNSGQGRCERCMGNGYEKIEMQFLSDLYVTCPECNGTRFQAHALTFKLDDKSIHDALQLTVDQSVAWFRDLQSSFETTDSRSDKSSARRCSQVVAQLALLQEAGLGYLTLGQPLSTLSGGEAQRLKLVGHLISGPALASGEASLLLLDEPTTGLHFDDIALLVKLLQRLVDEGHSLLVIEHNIEVIQCADWVIDLGPEGGAAGGHLVIAGTPEQVAACDASWTGKFLKSKFQPPSSKSAKRVSYRNIAPIESLRAAETLPQSEIENPNSIQIRGAREHNLKNLSIDIPRDQFVVVSGLSGSGKSSLAFDLVFAEGQRRFLDSMSVYARTFVEQMEKPDVDLVSGVPPTVAIEQRISRGGGKSTVATVTEVYHFLRLLFAKLGTQFCPKCEVPVKKQSLSAITETLLGLAKKSELHLMSPLIRARKGFHTEVAENARKHGIETLLVDGTFKPTAGFQKLARFKEHTIDAVVATVNKKTNPVEMRDLVERALKLGKGTLRLRDKNGEIRVLNTAMSCPDCGDSFEDLDPRLFSFNSPHGWCRACRGFGWKMNKPDPSPRRDDVSQLEAELEEERRSTSSSDDGEEEGEREVCPFCQGARLNPQARAVQLQGLHLHEIHAHASTEAEEAMGTLSFKDTEAVIARDIVTEIRQRLKFMREVGLGYLQLNRSADTLSGGEAQRIRLAAQLGSNLRGVLYVLDEPTIGLHPRDNHRLLDTLIALRDKGNSLLVVEHDDDTMRRADTIIDLGPGAGRFGGELVAQGTLAQLMKNKASITGQSLRHPLVHPLRGERRPLPKPEGKAPAAPKSKGKTAKKQKPPRDETHSTLPSSGWLQINGATANNLRDIDIRIPLSRLTVITGVSGSGKSTLLHGVLLPIAKNAAAKARHKKKLTDVPWRSARGFDAINAVHEVDQSPIGKTSRSCPATYVGVMDDIRKLFAQLPAARARGYGPGRFSFNTEGGRCEICSGNGEVKVEMNFLPTTRVHCEICDGMRFNSPTLEIEYNGRNIGQVLKMSITEAAEFFASVPRIARPLHLLAETGVGYLQLGQPSPTLSGGEAQRLKLVTELNVGQGKTATQRMRGLSTDKRNLYLIEEPTIGLHAADVARLIDLLHRLVDEGHTVVVIEHHPDVFAEADYLIDIGPEAGKDGGSIVAQGTPEEVAKHKTSHTAPFLRQMLGKSSDCIPIPT